MFGKDIMQQVTDTFDKLSDAEKTKRAQSLKKLMDEELKRRKQKPQKKPE